ncbi:MAG: hypothetical protein IPL67_06275 [Ignavibacteria bacterium]|nr:hypothetical protein [Ignavibacteria bacterium]
MKTLLLLLLSLSIIVSACGDNKEQSATDKKSDVKAGSENTTENKTTQETEKSKEELAAKEKQTLILPALENKQNDLG